MARLLGCAFVVGVGVWLACGPRVSAAAADCGKPVAPCTACHSPMLTQNYSDCAAKPWTAPPEAKELHGPLTASPKVIAEGKANYGIFCEGCHGPRADGAGPIAIKFSILVADLTTPQVQQQNDGELFWKLSHGYGAMPRWGDVLSDDDRWQLIAFIRSLKKSR
jgi:cytochrome c5